MFVNRPATSSIQVSLLKLFLFFLSKVSWSGGEGTFTNSLQWKVFEQVNLQCLRIGTERNTLKPLLSGRLRDLPKCLLILIEGVRLIEVCKNCAMFVND